MSLTRKLAHPLLASIFISGGIDALKNPEPRGEQAHELLEKARGVFPSIPDDDASAVRLNAIVQIGCGVLLAKGAFPRVSSLVLAASLVPTTLAGHQFWKAPSHQRQAQKVQFFKNASILGGLLLGAADTNGRPSLAWRAQHIKRPNWVPDVD